MWAATKNPPFRAGSWQPLSGQFGGERELLLSRCWGLIRVVRLLLSDDVRHQANFHPAVLGATFRAVVLRGWLIFAQSDQVNLVSRNLMLRGQILDDGTSTALAELVVVVFGTGRVGIAFQGNDVALGVRNLGGQLIECVLGLLGQVSLVEPEVHGGFDDWPIVVEVCDLVGERVNAGASFVGELGGLLSLLVGGRGLLISGIALRVYVGKPLGGSGVQALDG